MPDDEQCLRREIALFRFRLVGDLPHLPAGSEALKALLQQRAEAEHRIPGSRRRSVAASTLRHWLRACNKGGFDALYPKPRSDRGRSRALTAEAAELLTGIKESNPRLTVKAVIRQAHDSGRLPEGTRLAYSTVNRLLRRAGLMQRPRTAADGRDRRRFAYKFAGELAMSDVMHGPKIQCDAADRRRKAKTCLICLLDDATRVVTHAAFAFAESVDTFLPVFRQALLKRGRPLRLYVDNGSNFRSKHLQAVCAELGIALIHARPYRPEGKGKIERFFRTLRDQFLSTIADPGRLTLAQFNRRLQAWIEGEYHHTPHRGLDGDTPLDRWARFGERVHLLGPDVDLQRIFCYRLTRRVTRARTVSVHGRTYEVDAELVGEKVVLLRDPAAPPSRPLPVLHNGRESRATLLDVHANARIRRRPEPPEEQLPLSRLDPDSDPEEDS